MGKEDPLCFLGLLENNDVSGIRKLLSSGVSPDADLGDGLTPLSVASLKGHVEVTKLLIEHGAEINHRSNEGETALSLAAGSACNLPEDDDGLDEEEYWNRVFEGNHAKIVRMLLESGARADTHNILIRDFLGACCHKGQTTFVRLLLDAGADVNARDSVNITPLMKCFEHADTCRLLLERGADVSVKNDLEITALDVALANGWLAVAKLLVQHGADVNEQPYYLTRAAEDGHIEVVRFLLESGADPNRQDKEGDTALRHARREGHAEIVDLLREAMGLFAIRKQDFTRDKQAPEPPSLRKKDFFRDNEEELYRCWWMVWKIYLDVVRVFVPNTLVDVPHRKTLARKGEKYLLEVLGYVLSFVLNRLRDEIEHSHGWDKQAHALHIGYRVSIAYGLAMLFALDNSNKLTPEAADSFDDLLEAYYVEGYNDDYEDYWGVCDEPYEAYSDKTVGDLLQESLSPQEYNPERLHVFRVSRMLNVRHPQDAVDYMRSTYREIGLRFYDSAFFVLPLDKVKDELKELTSAPKEVHAALNVLEEAYHKLAGPRYDNRLPSLYDEAFQIVAKHIEEMLANQDWFVQLVQKGACIREWVYAAISNRAGDLVESGEYHFYRGELNPLGPGPDLLRLFDVATDESVQMRVINAEFAEKQKTAVRENLKGAG